MKYYYIHKHLPSEHQDMLDGPRIVELQTNAIKLQEEEGEGPYDSLVELKKDSIIYRQLIQENPRRAEKIASEQFLVKAEKIIFWPDGVDETFHKMVYRIMQHSSNGKVNRKGVSGIHLFDKNKINILKLINEDKTTGIFEAEIEVLNERTGEYIKKQGKTSFFPVNWGLQRLVFECYEAYNNMVEIDSNIYHGKTKSGIVLEFVYNQENIFRSVYPVVENKNNRD